MNKKLPYEEELSRQLNDLPLPDVNASWEDMKRRLDEDSDDGVIIPPLRRGCLGYSALLILLSVAIWLIVNPGKWPWNKKQKEITSSREINKTRKDDPVINSAFRDSVKNSTHTEPSILPVKHFDTIAGNNKGRLTRDSLNNINGNEKAPRQKIFSRSAVSINEYANPGNKTTQKNITGKYAITNKHIQKQPEKTEGSLKTGISGNEQVTDSSESDDKNINKSNNTIATNDTIDFDSTKKTTDSNTVRKKINDTTTHGGITKPDSAVKKQMYFAAGLALHQQLPVNGQKLVPYNSLGRKSTLGDYIPSVYVRLYRDKKWFLQSEFRYGAPQYNKEILYVQKKVVDTFTRSTLDTSNRLKKTYYHQLPVSFNYFVLPHFSVGLGFVWNKFSSAVSEQEIKRTNNVTQVDSVITKTILRPKRADSNFVKSYFQALIESQYQWKRWSIGARYSFGLQPYIRFQLPGGAQREEKNSSLEIFLRYNFWESQKK